ncbi:MAG: hypothetical protein WAN65_02230, partial [Candidatus Sulfotelmatobacter sp.]
RHYQGPEPSVCANLRPGPPLLDHSFSVLLMGNIGSHMNITSEELGPQVRSMEMWESEAISPEKKQHDPNMALCGLRKSSALLCQTELVRERKFIH